ncbi:MAG: hypothetical protein Q8933_16025 [Bacteroidota bacterium]|nr:hypothetical protein [Bacteroidota bacterium]MDP4192923.1 hypothetical protein [Bacteroidota bacterium]
MRKDRADVVCSENHLAIALMMRSDNPVVPVGVHERPLSIE